jgi:hypothetical protein
MCVCGGGRRPQIEHWVLHWQGEIWDTELLCLSFSITAQTTTSLGWRQNEKALDITGLELSPLNPALKQAHTFRCSFQKQVSGFQTPSIIFLCRGSNRLWKSSDSWDPTSELSDPYGNEHIELWSRSWRLRIIPALMFVYLTSSLPL